ncbi:MAG: hypothetical protein ACOC0M_06925, partial [Halomonas sp.]
GLVAAAVGAGVLVGRFARREAARGAVIALGGALLLTSARHPSALLRVARRVAAGGLVLRRARRLLR